MQRAEDSTLLERARAGDDKALEALLERHQAQVYRFGIKMCRDPEDAKDVLQETMLAMARGMRDFRGASSLSTWLYTVARSYCIKKRRRGKAAPPPEQLFDAGELAQARELVDPAQAPDEQLAGKQVERALDAAIAALEPSYREVLLLRDVEGLTAPEVAEVLGVSVQAVKSRLHRARVSVRARVAPLLGMPSESKPSPQSCPNVLTLLSRHLEGDISKLDCAEMEQHIEQCARCRSACDSLKQTLALCRASGSADAVPAKVQVAVKQALRGALEP